MEDCARRNDLLSPRPLRRRGRERALRRGAGTWTVRTAAGEEIVADVAGERGRPAAPAADAEDPRPRDASAARRFHSARWNHDVDLAGKRVGVDRQRRERDPVHPRDRARRSQHLTIFQRSANWMIARGDRAFHAVGDVDLRRTCPASRALYRGFLWGCAPSCSSTRSCAGTRARAASTPSGRSSNLEEHVTDPELRARLTPDYPIGGKRILIADDFYPALSRAERGGRHESDRARHRGRRRDRRRPPPSARRAHPRHRLPHQPVPRRR